MVEPEEQVLRAGLERIVHRCEGLVVLVDIACAVARAVESYAFGVSLVVEYRRPVASRAGLPWAGPVVRAGEDVVNALVDTMNECEFARYAPGDPAQAMDKIYTAATDVINKMENSIKR